MKVEIADLKKGMQLKNEEKIYVVNSISKCSEDAIYRYFIYARDIASGCAVRLPFMQYLNWEFYNGNYPHDISKSKDECCNCAFCKITECEKSTVTYSLQQEHCKTFIPMGDTIILHAIKEILAHYTMELCVTDRQQINKAEIQELVSQVLDKINFLLNEEEEF